MKKYKLTLIGLTIAVVFLLGTVIFDLDLFERVHRAIDSRESYEIDEFIIPIIIFGIFAFFDKTRRQKLRKIEDEKVKIYKAMMSSTHHILNNFLNQMELFKMIAEDTPGFNPEVLSLYEKTIEEASTQVEALSNITSIDEASIHASVAPKL